MERPRVTPAPASPRPQAGSRPIFFLPCRVSLPLRLPRRARPHRTPAASGAVSANVGTPGSSSGSGSGSTPVATANASASAPSTNATTTVSVSVPTPASPSSGTGGSTGGSGGSTVAGGAGGGAGGGGGGSVAIGGFSGLYDSAAAGGLADAIGPRCVAVLRDPRHYYEHYQHRLWEHCRWLAGRYAKRHQASK